MTRTPARFAGGTAAGSLGGSSVAKEDETCAGRMRVRDDDAYFTHVWLCRSYPLECVAQPESIDMEVNIGRLHGDPGRIFRGANSDRNEQKT